MPLVDSISQLLAFTNKRKKYNELLKEVENCRYICFVFIFYEVEDHFKPHD